MGERALGVPAAQVWLQKEGSWRRGELQGDRITWERPEGTGVRSGLVREQSLPEMRDAPVREVRPEAP